MTRGGRALCAFSAIAIGGLDLLSCGGPARDAKEPEPAAPEVTAPAVAEAAVAEDTSPSGRAEALAELACACKDKQCAETALVDFKGLVTEQKGMKLTDTAALDRRQKATERTIICLMREGASEDEVFGLFEGKRAHARKKHAEPAPPGPKPKPKPKPVADTAEGAAAAADVARAADAACACKDKPCAEAALAGFVAVVAKHKNTNASDANMERTKQAAARCIKCLTSLGVSEEAVFKAISGALDQGGDVGDSKPTAEDQLWERAIRFSEQLAEIVDRTQDDCARMATEINALIDQHGALMAEAKKRMETDPASAKGFMAKYRDRLNAMGKKMAAGMSKCGSDANVQKSLQRLE